MKFLPAILEMTKARPGSDAGKDRHLVPNEEYDEFWEAFYKTLRTHFHFEAPVKDFEKKINPYFGYFGSRFHPIKLESNYYHLGLDVSDKAKTPICPIFSGILEYSGFGHINGNYVFLSHPDIVTEDGFKLFSIYMHLKSVDVKFSSYQKMLRQISFNHYPNIEVKSESVIGKMGSTGISEGTHVHLHLQIEFRNEKGSVVAINPALVLGVGSHENQSAKIENAKDFQSFCDIHEKDMKKFNIEVKKFSRPTNI